MSQERRAGYRAGEPAGVEPDIVEPAGDDETEAMVYVGDIYALTARGSVDPGSLAAVAAARPDDEEDPVSPFLR